MLKKEEDNDGVMLIKDRYKNSKEKCIDTHFTCGFGGIDGFYSAEELIKYYGECESTKVYYEKDYGDCIVIRSFLVIDSDKNYDKEIKEERKLI